MRHALRATLGGRQLLANGLLALAVVASGAATFWGISGLRAAVERSTAAYDDLQVLSGVDTQINRSRRALRLSPRDIDAALRGIISARRGFEPVERRAARPGTAGSLQRDVTAVAQELQAVQADLLAMRQVVGRAPGSGTRDVAERLGTVSSRVRGLLVEAIDEMRVAGWRSDALLRTTVTIGAVAAISILTVSGATFLGGIRQRRLSVALQELRTATARIASGGFEERVDERSCPETAGLARDFNEMAAALRALYRAMEAEVERKSGELARSERLASVGRLAAGVAHEINNPLNIISGYAELGRKWLEGRAGADRIGESRDALDTIREEAFRCKRIVERLASLSVPGYESRNEVSLSRVVRDVLTLVGGLKRYQGRSVTFDAGSRDSMVVCGNEAKLKQVVLNLVVNALQAVDPEAGSVQLSLEEADGWARLTVSDNGCGMTPDTMQKVFEPFFSHRRPDQKRGLGLGLTISHGIVEAHGGRLLFESEGPAKGSRFVVELPVTG